MSEKAGLIADRLFSFLFVRDMDLFVEKIGSNEKLIYFFVTTCQSEQKGEII